MSRCSLTPPPFVKRRTISLGHAPIVKEEADENSPPVQIIRRSPISKSAPADGIQLLPPSPAPATHHSQSLVPQAVASAKTSSNSCTVLVINASQPMAHEITHQLSVTLPGSTILFAPTLHLALWILKRRSIDLILTSSVLPDGPLNRLHEFLEQLTLPPELVVLSELSSSRSELSSHPGYRFVELRRISSQSSTLPYEPTEAPDLTKTISALGADLRNDLNNPLQEIVAMAFVAHSSQGLSPSAEQALSAIQRAASNMATVVNKLEDKIRGAVGG